MEQEIVEEPEGELPLAGTGDDTPAEPAATEGDSAPSGDEPAAAPVKKDGMQEGFDRLTRLRRDAERDADYQRGRADTAEARVKELESPATDTPAGAISADNYDTHEEYLAALVTRSKEEAKAELRVEFQQAGEQKAITDKNVERNQQLIDAAKDTPEIAEAGIASLPWTESLLQAMDGPNLPIVALELAKNPVELTRINALPPSQQGKEIAKLEARLTAKPSPKKTTTAPEPLEPVSMGGDSPDPKPANQKTYEENEADWEAKRLKRLGVKQ